MSPSAAPAPTPAPTVHPLLSDRYGLIVHVASPMIRSEASAEILARLGGAFAVSADGRRVAYWESRRLYVIDLARPGQRSEVFRLAEGEAVTAALGRGAIAWSTDGTGLLIAVTSAEYVPSEVPDPPLLWVTLRHLDLTTGSVHELYREEPGHPVHPLTWDRANAISAAVWWGPGGFSFAHFAIRDDGARVQPSRQRQDYVATLPSAFQVAPDASRVLWRTFFADEPQGVWIAPLADASQFTRLEAQNGERVVGALWRDAMEILVSISSGDDSDDGERLEIWPVDGTKRVLFRGEHRLEGVRPDGTAAVTNNGLIDLKSGVLAPIPGYSGGAVASVILR